MFSKKTNKRSLEEIHQAISTGLEVDGSHPGFKNRNSKVAESDYLIAFHHGKTENQLTGGTLDTWNKCRGTKIYICIGDL
jgi:hypothetical protein